MNYQDRKTLCVTARFAYKYYNLYNNLSCQFDLNIFVLICTFANRVTDRVLPCASRVCQCERVKFDVIIDQVLLIALTRNSVS